MTRLLAVTSGYAYDGWRGSFYPEDLPGQGMLRYYAERFPTVEINNTFYRLPSEAMLRRWVEQVGEGFVFVLKASRRITHERRLHGVEDTLRYLLETASALGPKMGPLLFQLPPFLRRDVQRLAAFLALLPRGVRAAFEFRHPSWLDEEVYGLLRGRDAALCIADTEDGDPPRVPTAGWGYLRLRRPAYSEAELAEWAGWIRSQAWSDAFVFFKHEDEGAGPRLAAELIRIFPS